MADRKEVNAEPAAKPRRRWWRILKRVLLTLVVILLFLIFGVFPYWVAGVATGASTRPPDRRLTETPATFGAEFKEVEFHTADNVKISAWWLPSRSKQTTIIFSHGLFRSRRELLERAIDLWKLGYGALLYDSRNHGESGAARVTLGYNERLDAKAAVAFLREEARTSDRIVLFGISMGAAAALLAAAETPEVAAAISDSAFLSFKETIDHHVRMFLRLPAFPLSHEIRFFIEQRGDFDGAQIDMLDAVNRIGDRPILFLSGANDQRMPPDIARQLYAAAASAKRDLLIIDGDATRTHGHAYQAAPQAYINKIDSFLTAARD